MYIRPSSALRNDYSQLSNLAKQTGEPIFITSEGEDDAVFMSMETYEEREKMFRHREMIYEAVFSKLNGENTYTPDEVDARMEVLFDAFAN